MWRFVLRTSISTCPCPHYCRISLWLPPCITRTEVPALITLITLPTCAASICLFLSYSDFSCLMCCFAYNYPVLITGPSCAASLATFLPHSSFVGGFAYLFPSLVHPSLCAASLTTTKSKNPYEYPWCTHGYPIDIHASVYISLDKTWMYPCRQRLLIGL